MEAFCAPQDLQLKQKAPAKYYLLPKIRFLHVNINFLFYMSQTWTVMVLMKSIQLFWIEIRDFECLMVSSPLLSFFFFFFLTEQQWKCWKGQSCDSTHLWLEVSFYWPETIKMKLLWKLIVLLSLVERLAGKPPKCVFLSWCLWSMLNSEQMALKIKREK